MISKNLAMTVQGWRKGKNARTKREKRGSAREKKGMRQGCPASSSSTTCTSRQGRSYLSQTENAMEEGQKYRGENKRQPVQEVL